MATKERHWEGFASDAMMLVKQQILQSGESLSGQTCPVPARHYVWTLPSFELEYRPIFYASADDTIMFRAHPLGPAETGWLTEAGIW